MSSRVRGRSAPFIIFVRTNDWTSPKYVCSHALQKAEAVPTRNILLAIRMEGDINFAPANIVRLGAMMTADRGFFQAVAAFIVLVFSNAAAVAQNFPSNVPPGLLEQLNRSQQQQMPYNPALQTPSPVDQVRGSQTGQEGNDQNQFNPQGNQLNQMFQLNQLNQQLGSRGNLHRSSRMTIRAAPARR